MEADRAHNYLLCTISSSKFKSNAVLPYPIFHVSVKEQVLHSRKSNVARDIASMPVEMVSSASGANLGE